MLNDDLLKKFMNEFYGYGNLGGKFWFIGMEEGGGNSSGEIAERLRLWQMRGGKVTDDLNEFGVELGFKYPEIAAFIPPTIKRQTTWRGLIRVLVKLRSLEIGYSQESRVFKNLQGTDFCRLTADHCNLNLMPLPSPNINAWNYSGWSQLSELKTRKLYEARYGPLRIKFLRELIAQHSPQVVMIYGNTGDENRGKLEQLCGGSLERFGDSPYLRGRKVGNTTFASMPHPACKGITEGMFDFFGLSILKYSTEEAALPA